MIIPNFDVMTIEELEDFLDTWMDFKTDPSGWRSSEEKTLKFSSQLPCKENNLFYGNDLLSYAFFSYSAKCQRRSGNIERALNFEGALKSIYDQLPENLKFKL